jgi:hypothetical protein
MISNNIYPITLFSSYSDRTPEATVGSHAPRVTVMRAKSLGPRHDPFFPLGLVPIIGNFTYLARGKAEAVYYR